MIIFMGVAGSGKSSQGRQLADEKGLPWLSTGEFLRMMIAGDKRKQMLEGKLLGDEEIITMVQKIFAVVDTLTTVGDSLSASTSNEGAGCVCCVAGCA